MPVDLIGRVFGELTVISLESERRGTSRVWLCSCLCGGQALRTTYQLQEAERRGWQPCCLSCYEELYGGIRHQKRTERIDRFKELWELDGTLYSEVNIAIMEEDVRSELIREYGEPVEKFPWEADYRVAIPMSHLPKLPCREPTLPMPEYKYLEEYVPAFWEVDFVLRNREERAAYEYKRKYWWWVSGKDKVNAKETAEAIETLHQMQEQEDPEEEGEDIDQEIEESFPWDFEE